MDSIRMSRRSWTADDKRVVGARQLWNCNVCKKVLESTFEVDHIVPLHEGGEDKLENAQALCCGCHAKKTQQERLKRQQLARERLAELQKEEDNMNNTSNPSKKRERAERVERVVLRPAEDIILDAENPFAKYAYMPPS